jgi:phenylalanyl-tRNA synthetase beta chain
MKLSERWLREWVDPPVDTAGIVSQLTMAGLEVDGTAPATPAFSSVVVGLVEAVERHPDADKLTVCRVDVGAADTLAIVCGAPNVRAGMKAPVALVGAELPGGLKVKRARLRGVESAGMLCSERELGLGDSHAGLWDLPADAPVGRDLRDWLGLDDAVIDVDLTPNRGDCFSVLGIARELALINGMPLGGPPIMPVPAGNHRRVSGRGQGARGVSALRGARDPRHPRGRRVAAVDHREIAARGTATDSPGRGRHQHRHARARPADAWL